MSASSQQRRKQIVTLLQGQPVLDVARLADLLGTSPQTIRRDLKALSYSGRVRRFHGGAESMDVRSIDASAPPVFDVQKRAIARACADLVRDAKRIVITGGTTTLALAEILAYHNIDVLTHSLEIASIFLKNGYNNVTMPGGTIYREQDIVIDAFGSKADSFASADIAFTGCHAISKWGLMEADPFVARAQAMMLSRAQKVVVLADSSKIRRTSSIVVADLNRIAALVTDDGVKREELAEFHAAGVRVIVAKVNHGA